MVESGGDVDKIGDGGQAIGPFQIHEVYWSDAVEYDTSLKSGGNIYQNCKGEGPADEDLARIHNGGPNGYQYIKVLGESAEVFVETHTMK